MTLEDKIRSGLYDNDLPYSWDSAISDAYNKREDYTRTLFMRDLRDYLLDLNVPKAFVGKVASKAWEDGHASGYMEIFNHASNLADIFN